MPSSPTSRPLATRPAATPWQLAAVSAAALLALAACGGGDGSDAATASALGATAAPATAGKPAQPPVAQPGPKPQTTLALRKLGDYTSPGGVGASEIPAYDPKTRRAFVVNGALGTVEVLDLSDPSAPTLVASLSTAAFGAGLGGANGVAVARGIVALAIEAVPKTRPGLVALLDARTLQLISTVAVGALPDMLTFTPDGKTLLVANEGEPSAYGTGDASNDPEGSVSLIDVSNPHAPKLRTVDFRAYDGREAELRAAGVRIFGPGASASQDFEPEYITVSEDGKTAWVALQENNAFAVIDVKRARLTDIKPLGHKDFNLEGFGLDASDEDGGSDTNSGSPRAHIAPQPVRGLYLPDAIASFKVKGQTYLISANEGDARADWPGFNEETRVREHCAAGGLDPTVFGADASRLLFDSNLGRLRITNTPNGGYAGRNAQGQCEALYAFGGRSITVWDAQVRPVWDSGDALERLTLEASQAGAFNFNASHDNNTLDGRSPTKGPEPEGVTIGEIAGRTYAFVGLERVGGIVTYDVSDPKAPVFVDYLNTRVGVTGDRGPEGLAFVAAKDSPTGQPLLIVGHEVSGTTVVYQVDRVAR